MSQKVSSQEIREKFLQFFKEKGHAVIPSASLIPENDPTVLFTTAGMHPLVPFLLGEKHPSGKRLCNFQKCVRTGDIDRIGDAWYLSFFEMLGNWSFGDYFKKEAIEWSFEFLSSKKWLGIEKEKLSITVFAGDKDAGRDEESARAWKELGIPEERIFYFPKSENWWGPAGLTGPCGPCTEMFYDTGKPYCIKGKGPKINEQCNPGCKCGKFVEIWNDVFMQYNKTAEGKFIPLKQKNVDTGMGLERITAILNSCKSNFETDLLEGIMRAIQSVSKVSVSESNLASARIITDHLRAATFILGDEKGITPSNVDQGYVLRRLIRRAVRHARLLGIEENFTAKIAGEVIERFKSVYPELGKNRNRILTELDKEESKFKSLLEKGLKLVSKEFETLRAGKKKTLAAKTAFDLYQSFGFPLEMTQELAKEQGFKVDETGFEKMLSEHQELSRKGAEQKFSGGLADHSEAVTRLHTATHLLNEALRKIVSPNIHQKGSNITSERLRFDFPLERKLSAEEIRKVEDLVNLKIQEGLTVEMEVMSLEKAKAVKAQGVFEGKYAENVKVYTVWNPHTQEVFSREICGGPHVKNTKELGKFKIVKEESSAAGIRRIKAVLEN